MRERSQDEQIERRIESVLISKVQIVKGIVVFIATFVLPVIGLFFKIQMDVALIKQNHEAHMQRALEEIAEGKETDALLMNAVKNQNDSIIKLLLIHKNEL